MRIAITAAITKNSARDWPLLRFYVPVSLRHRGSGKLEDTRCQSILPFTPLLNRLFWLAAGFLGIKIMKYLNLIVGSSLLLLSACDGAVTGEQKNHHNSGGMKHEAASSKSTVDADFSTVMHGGKLFAANCAVCHGQLAQGSPGWQKKDASGHFPPPPLNGSGHAWHHSKKAITQTIKFGTLSRGGSMPPWKDKLSDQDIEAIVAWMHSLWPQKIKESWAATNARGSHH